MLKTALVLFNDAGAAEDAVQQIFLKLARRPGGTNDIKNEGKYLYSCIANEARNFYRRRSRDTKSGDLSHVAGEDRPAGQWLILNEELVQLAEVMQMLNHEQREVVLLHVEAGMKFREIAELQGISINTVMSRYRYGIEKLRSLLNGKVSP